MNNRAVKNLLADKYDSHELGKMKDRLRELRGSIGWKDYLIILDDVDEQLTKEILSLNIKDNDEYLGDRFKTLSTMRHALYTARNIVDDILTEEKKEEINIERFDPYTE